MADPDIPFQLPEIFRIEYLFDQSHVLMGFHFPKLPLCIADSNAAAFLSPVLQGCLLYTSDAADD